MTIEIQGGDLLAAAGITQEDKTLVELTLELALSKEGVKEAGENWGAEVQQFLAAAKIHEPAPWCAAFVNWAAENAAKTLNVTSPLESVPIQGYVQSYVEFGKKHGWVVSAEEVKPGDLFCVYHKSLSRYAHIGLVTKVDLKKRVFNTVEGNTNDDGSREGYEVAARKGALARAITKNILFLRWA